jgi:hypothetical protein
MAMHGRSLWLGMLAGALCMAAAWYFYPGFGQSQVRSGVVAAEVPVVIRTEGGLLEVATVKATERFSRSDTREFGGLSLGTTVSHIQAPAYYRYQIGLAKSWQAVLKDNKQLVVQAPALQPSLPVALDMAALQSRTENGWARMNREENLAALQQSIGPELARRAMSSAYLELAREPARKTIEEFVRQWVVREKARVADSGGLLSNRNPALPAALEIRVVFPDEAGALVPEAAASAAD